MLSKPKRVALIALPVLLVLVSLLALSLIRPPVPGPWYDLRMGMTREEVGAEFDDYDSVLLELKGRDLMTSEGAFLGESGIWYLDLEFDDEGRLASGWLTFRNDISGLFNVDRSFPLRAPRPSTR
jgi:hypothetical protein